MPPQSFDPFQSGRVITVVDALRHWATQQPDSRAFTFLPDGEIEQTYLSYSQLDLRARSIAAALDGGAVAGDRAVLLYPSDADFVTAFFGCLYAGVTAVPAYPLDPARLQRTVARLISIIADAQASTALTTTATLRVIEQLIPQHPELGRVRWVATEAIPDNPAADGNRSMATPEELAVLQYTSGSTGTPRGVRVTHRNMLENARLMHGMYSLSPAHTLVNWLPLSHDLGLFAYVVHPVLLGTHGMVMPPEAFLQKPVRWLRTISRFPAVSSAAPNFAYELCVRRVTEEERAGLDLSGWVVAVMGAEPVRADTLQRFVDTFGPCGFRREAFYNGYGLAESTLVATGAQNPRILRVSKTELEQNHAVEELDAERPYCSIVSTGVSHRDERVEVVDPDEHTVCSSGQVGEVWISGGNIADGYWNNPEQSKRTFGAVLKNSNEGPFLRTGDLGFKYEGELYITGRRKDVLIIRGRNIYPQDLEAAVMNCHPSLRAGGTVAFSIEAHAEERIVIVQELRDAYRGDLQEVADAIRETVFEESGTLAYAVILVPRGVIPKTSSGKLQRSACRAAYLGRTLNTLEESVLDGAWLNRKKATGFVAPRTLAEKKVAAIWSAILHVEQIGVSDRFFDLGGDSLAAAECAAELCEAFELDKVPPELFLLAPSLEQMALAVSDPEHLAALAAGIQPIQPSGDGLPLFLVGPGLEARNLPAHFGANQPVFGIAWPRLDQLTAPYTVEKIATQCIASLLRYRPEGPFLLAGWCGAGVVAYEMARQLVAAGKLDTSVILLDVRNFFLPPMHAGKRAFVQSCYGMQKLSFLGTRLRRRGKDAIREVVAWRKIRARETVRRALASSARTFSDAYDEAIQNYRPQPFAGRIIHVWAMDRPKGRYADPAFGWNHLATNGFDFVEVPGDHVTMLHDPNVQRIAEILTAEMDRIAGKTRQLSPR